MARWPASTYRFQLNAAFGFEAATALVPYLHRLGIDALYSSPILQARPGSTHGYDTTDPRRLNPELGDEEALRSLSRALQDHRMGLVLDIVPNHAAADVSNPMWLDVLEHGAGSEYAGFFDILWDEEGRLLLPILGDELDAVLARGELALDRSGPKPLLRYFDRALPVRDVDAAEASDLRALLDRQVYRLAHWRRASAEINYRRFFDISDLVGIRVEDPAVFDATHALIARLVEDGIVTGLRVDHIDGLIDPAEYLVRLSERVLGGRAGYVVVEKILERDERLPGEWPVDGTTGYDYMVRANGLCVSVAGLERLSAVYARFTGANPSFDDVVFRRKLQVQEELFSAELERLLDRLGTLLGDSSAAALDRDLMRVALAAVTAGMPRYRTYFARNRVREEDREVVHRAVAEARRRQADVPAIAYDVLESILTVANTPPAARGDRLDFVMRWQQYTGPVMAKGHEDTAMYVYNRLMSANAVGGDPADPVATMTDFHRWLIERREWTGAMNATSTHDSKRSEDVRARIDVLSELPDEWQAALERWRAMNSPLRPQADGQLVPDPNTEMLVYQTLVGAWPIEAGDEVDFPERLRDYLLKAAREAKTFTSWMEPNQAWEEALLAWSDAILQPAHGFTADLRAFVEDVAAAGALNSLGQVLLKVAAPGVPDFYQGSELWSLTLVDPDNRRPVDYVRRARLLDELEATLAAPTPQAAAELWRDWRSGLVKLYVTAATLRDRREKRQLHLLGEHFGVPGRGPRSANLCGLARHHGGEWRVALVPLRVRSAEGSTRPPPGAWPSAAGWAGTTAVLPDSAPTRWRNRLTGEVVEAPNAEVPLERVFASLPLALLEPAER
ncbi:MAG TPA: malto-oligosyltrehalose synthase [Longimicrobiales bacterium]|nr:malto-oligosyltrehalose synthase [Longimicrobiales bacterium]